MRAQLFSDLRTPAATAGSGRPRCGGKRIAYGALSGLALGLHAGPAAAQLGGSIGIDSDYRLRGYSLTADHPAVSAQLTYDHPSGFYADLSALTELSSDVRFLGVIANAGYARRLSSRVTVDAGVLRSQIRSASGRYPGFRYSEVYAGAFVGPISARIHYSPDYRSYGQSTLYGELEGGFEPAPNWRVSGHVGMLMYLNSASFYEAGSTHQDWRVSASRQFGNFEVHTALSGGGPSRYYGLKVHKKTALTAGASVSF
jgi:uncharacterized protein (TIGR02001 family)